jgi:uncharacterized membrane protein
VVADLGVLEAVPPKEWDAAAAAIREAVASGGDGEAVAARLHAMAEMLGDALPAGPGDVNELPDEVAAP